MKYKKTIMILSLLIIMALTVNAFQFGYNGFERLGIGTNTPSHSLNVVGDFFIETNGGEIGTLASDGGLKVKRNITSTSALLRVRNADDDNVMYITGEGKIGIGTDTPNTEVHIFGRTSQVLFIESDNNGTAVDTNIILDADEDSQIRFRKNTITQFRIKFDEGTTQFQILNSSANVIQYYEQSGNAWFVGDVSALSFTDRTRGPKDTVDVLTELKNIKVDSKKCKGNKCEIDKSSLPYEMIVPYQHCLKSELNFENETICIQEETRYGRDLTYTVSHLIKQNQLLLDRIEALESR